MARGRHRGDHQQVRVLGREGQGGQFHLQGDGLARPDKLLVKAGGLAAGEDDGQQVQGVEIRVVHAHDMKPGQQGLHLGDLLDHGPALAPLGRLHDLRLRGYAGVGNLAEIPVHQVPGPLGLHVPGDDHGDLARVVVVAVVGQAIVQGQTVQVLVPAHHRPL